MNIFMTDECPVKSAVNLCDKHVNKMLLESTQMLSTAHRILDHDRVVKKPSRSGKTMLDHYELEDYEAELIYYKVAHKNHPCNIWLRESDKNYRWLWDHTRTLCQEYTYRYGKHHKCENLLHPLRSCPINIPVTEHMTPFKRAVGDDPEYTDDPSTVSCYRKYYQSKASAFKMLWTKRQQPEWFAGT
jgi:hypothetical protein